MDRTPFMGLDDASSNDKIIDFVEAPYSLGNMVGSGGVVTKATTLQINISKVYCKINDAGYIVNALSNQNLNTNSIYYIYVNTTPAITISTSPPSDPVNYVPLAVVITDGSDILASNGINDVRPTGGIFADVIAFGARGDGVVDDEDAIDTALEEEKLVILSQGTYKYKSGDILGSGGVTVPRDVRLDLGTKIGILDCRDEDIPFGFIFKHTETGSSQYGGLRITSDLTKVN